jgi:large subunit ribosomal protein L13
MIKATTSTKISQITRDWYYFDVKDKILGRVATEIAHALIGKSKPYFVYNLDCGNNVVVVNAKYVKVTGKKEKEKLYSKYSGYPGGLKQKPLWRVREENPTEIIKSAVLGMLPKNKLRDRLKTRLFIFPEADHPYKDKFIKK